MWRLMILAITAFMAGMFHSALQLDLRAHWQIPAAVGLAVFLAMHGVRRPRKKSRERATISQRILSPRLNAEFIEGEMIREKPIENEPANSPARESVGMKPGSSMPPGALPERSAELNQ